MNINKHLQHCRIWGACNVYPEKVLLCGLSPISVRMGVLGGEARLGLIIDCLLNYLSTARVN